jgi:hypothetical protein
MNDSQKCEVVRIKLELLEIEMDNKDVDEYMRLSSLYPGPAIGWPRHHVDGSMHCLPKGTIPHDEYEKTLNDLVEGIKKAETRVLKNQLYIHLTKYRPIDAKAFFEKLDALIEERMTLFTDIMRDEVKAINASKVSHM